MRINILNKSKPAKVQVRVIPPMVKLAEDWLVGHRKTQQIINKVEGRNG